VNQHENQLEFITFTDKKASHFIQKYEQKITLDFSKPSYAKYQISNNGKQVMTSYGSYGAIDNINVCTFSTHVKCSDVAEVENNEVWLVQSQMFNEDEIYLLYSNGIQRRAQVNPVWNTNWETEESSPPKTMSFYRNLVLITNKNSIKIVDKNTGALVWDKSQSNSKVKYGDLNNSYITKDNYLIIPLNNKPEYARKDLSSFLN